MKRIKSVILLSIGFHFYAHSQENKTHGDSIVVKYNLAATGLIQTGNVDRTLLPLYSNIALSREKIEFRQTLNYSWGNIGSHSRQQKAYAFT
jgi:hypothetical protein